MCVQSNTVAPRISFSEGRTLRTPSRANLINPLPRCTADAQPRRTTRADIIDGCPRQPRQRTGAPGARICSEAHKEEQFCKVSRHLPERRDTYTLHATPTVGDIVTIDRALERWCDLEGAYARHTFKNVLLHEHTFASSRLAWCVPSWHFSRAVSVFLQVSLSLPLTHHRHLHTPHSPRST